MFPACSIEPTETGDYKLCFDNSFSTISEKLVFFELIFDGPQEDEDLNGWAEMTEPEETLDIKIEDIKVGQEPGGACGHRGQRRFFDTDVRTRIEGGFSKTLHRVTS